jgi:hypothetical protein
VTPEENPYWDTMFELYEHTRKLQGLFFVPAKICDLKDNLDEDSGLWWRDVTLKKCKKSLGAWQWLGYGCNSADVGTSTLGLRRQNCDR